MKAGEAFLRLVESDPEFQGPHAGLKNKIKADVLQHLAEHMGEMFGGLLRNTTEIAAKATNDLWRKAREEAERQAEPIRAALLAQFEVDMKQCDDAWEQEFGEPCPKTIEEWSAFQIRIKMGSGWTFSDDASGDEMWGTIQAYLKGLKERKAMQSADEDGPCGSCKWRHNGVESSGTMQVGAWKMVKYLWGQADYVATFDDLIVPVYDDANHIADENAFGSLRKAANRFFRDNSIPLAVSLSKATVTLQPE